MNEDKPLGTAGSLRFLKNKFDSPFFVSNCDTIVKNNYYDIMQFYKNCGYDIYNRCLEIIERNHLYRVTGFCEPQLMKYDLYPDRGTQKPRQSVFRLLNILNYCDGERNLLWIAERLKCPIWELFDDVEVLLKNELIERTSNGA